jgi:TPR repeat protein
MDSSKKLDAFIQRPRTSSDVGSQDSNPPRSPRFLLDMPSFSQLSISGDSFSDPNSLSPRLETTTTEHSIIGLDNIKRDLQIENQCKDMNEIQINEMDIRLDTALELKSIGRLDEARDVYSEIVDQCEKMGILYIKDPILREAIWGLQANCSEKSFNFMLTASSRPGRVAAQHLLGLTYLMDANKDESAAYDLLIRSADKNYTPALHSLVDLANNGSEQAQKCLLKLVYKKRELASQIIEKQLDFDVQDEYLKIQMKQAIADGENENIHAIKILEEQALMDKKFAIYFFAEQRGKGKECAINEQTKEKISHFIMRLSDETNSNNNKVEGNCIVS